MSIESLIHPLSSMSMNNIPEDESAMTMQIPIEEEYESSYETEEESASPSSPSSACLALSTRYRLNPNIYPEMGHLSFSLEGGFELFADISHILAGEVDPSQVDEYEWNYGSGTIFLLYSTSFLKIRHPIASFDLLRIENLWTCNLYNDDQTLNHLVHDDYPFKVIGEELQEALELNIEWSLYQGAEFKLQYNLLSEELVYAIRQIMNRSCHLLAHLYSTD